MKKRFLLIMMIGLLFGLILFVFVVEKKEVEVEVLVNVVVLFDVSGSMVKRIDGVFKFNLVKKEIFKFVSLLLEGI